MVDLVRQLIREHEDVISKLDVEVATTIALRIARSLQEGGTVYIAGNGGSAADSQHIAAELVGRFKQERQAFRAVALTVDSSIITAVANDYSYDDIFVRQLEAYLSPGDVFWALSTSGNSPNIVKACAFAQNQGALVVGFTGVMGGLMKHHCDLVLYVAHNDSDRIQEAHSLCYHIVCEIIENNVKERK